jgi:hypothetical protein
VATDGGTGSWSTFQAGGWEGSVTGVTTKAFHELPDEQVTENVLMVKIDE